MTNNTNPQPTRLDKLINHDLRLNHYLKIANSANGKVAAMNHGNATNIFVYQNLQNVSDQEWIVFPLDGNKYLLANRLEGNVAAISAKSKNPDNLFGYNYLPNTPDQQWTIESQISNSLYKIRNVSNGKVVAISLKAKDPNGMFVYDDLGDIPDQQWSYNLVGEINIPTIPTFEKLDEVPQYTSAGQVLPSVTTRKLISATLIPCLMVNDNQWSLKTKIEQSPYYVLEKYQYWKRLENLSLLPQEKQKSSYTYGTTKTVQTETKQTIGFTFSTDTGMNFKGGNAVTGESSVTEDIKTQLSTELVISISNTEVDMESTTIEHEITNPFKDSMQYAKYILATDLVLKRANNSEVLTSTFTDKNTIIATSFPKDPDLLDKNTGQ